MSPLRIVILLALVVVIGFVLYTRFGGDRLSPAEAVQNAGPDVTILDVRSAEEFASGHLAGAVNANVMAPEFQEAVQDLPRDKPVYAYCASGMRSGRAAGMLKDMGFEEVYNVGGINALAAAGAEIER